MATFVKFVTANVAAEAMGGFSRPYACTNARGLAQSEEVARGIPSSWETHLTSEEVRAKHLSAKAHCAEVDAAASLQLWWCANHSVGERKLVTDEGADVVTIVDWMMGNDYDFWEGFAPSQVSEAEYASASSGSALRWQRRGTTPEGEVWGKLEFVPPVDRLDYRGAYFAAWEGAPGEIVNPDWSSDLPQIAAPLDRKVAELLGDWYELV